MYTLLTTVDSNICNKHEYMYPLLSTVDNCLLTTPKNSSGEGFLEMILIFSFAKLCIPLVISWKLFIHGEHKPGLW